MCQVRGEGVSEEPGVRAGGLSVGGAEGRRIESQCLLVFFRSEILVLLRRNVVDEDRLAYQIFKLRMPAAELNATHAQKMKTPLKKH